MKKIATKIAAGTIATAAIVLGTAGPAAAGTWTGKIYSYKYDSSALNPYNVRLTTGYSLWLYSNTRINNCESVSISSGSYISLTNLSRIKSGNKIIRVDTYTHYPSTINCI